MAKIDPKIIQELVSRVTQKPIDEIDLNKSFRNDLKMDSLQSLDLLVLIEEELEVVVPQEAAVSIQTVQQLVDFLNK